MFDAVKHSFYLVSKGLGKFNHLVSFYARNSAGLLLVIMLVFIIAQVVFREFNNSLSWTEELSKFAMVWVACLVAPWAYRENLNVSIQMFADSLPRWLRAVTEILINILVLFIAWMFFMESIEFWQGGLAISASSVPVKLAVFYSCIPFAFAAIFLIAIEKLFMQFSGRMPEHLSPSVFPEEGKS